MEMCGVGSWAFCSASYLGSPQDLGWKREVHQQIFHGRLSTSCVCQSPLAYIILFHPIWNHARRQAGISLLELLREPLCSLRGSSELCENHSKANFQHPNSDITET